MPAHVPTHVGVSYAGTQVTLGPARGVRRIDMETTMVLRLEQLASDALACWRDASSLARAHCKAEWDAAIAALASGNVTEARRALERARVIGEAEGGGWEESEAIRLLDESMLEKTRALAA